MRTGQGNAAKPPNGFVQCWNSISPVCNNPTFDGTFLPGSGTNGQNQRHMVVKEFCRHPSAGS
jgi:hypothetical protein